MNRRIEITQVYCEEGQNAGPTLVSLYQLNAGCPDCQWRGAVTSITCVPMDEGGGVVIDFADGTRRYIPEHRIWWWDGKWTEKQEAPHA